MFGNFGVQVAILIFAVSAYAGLMCVLADTAKEARGFPANFVFLKYFRPTPHMFAVLGTLLMLIITVATFTIISRFMSKNFAFLSLTIPAFTLFTAFIIAYSPIKGAVNIFLSKIKESP